MALFSCAANIVPPRLGSESRSGERRDDALPDSERCSQPFSEPSAHLWAPCPRVFRRQPSGRLGRCFEAGFSLIEVMVTLVVLGIGMLGLAALQITGLRVNDEAMYRTRAAMAATDIADRVRAQPEVFNAAGIGAAGGLSIAKNGCDNAPQCNADSDAVTCWRHDFCTSDSGRAPLPKPTTNGDFANIDCADNNACGSENCAITIRWSSERAGSLDPGGGGDSEFRFCTRIPAAL